MATQLAEKAMLVKLTIRRTNLLRRDVEAEHLIQRELEDASLVVNSRLFKSPGNPIQQIMQAMHECYTYHKKHTLPYVDAGPRILPNTLYMEYTEKMRGLIAEVEAMLNRYMPTYATYVQQDIDWRCEQARISGKPARAKVEDYPDAESFRASMGLDIRFYPLPDKRHFLFDISEEDEQAFESAMEEAAAAARVDAIKRMLTPLRHLTDKLAKPIGSEGSIFRNATLENVLEGIDIAEKLNMDDNAEVKETLTELRTLVKAFDVKKDWLRESPVVRAQAHEKLADIASKMSAFMGGAS